MQATADCRGSGPVILVLKTELNRLQRSTKFDIFDAETSLSTHPATESCKLYSWNQPPASMPRTLKILKSSPTLFSVHPTYFLQLLSPFPNQTTFHAQQGICHHRSMKNRKRTRPDDIGNQTLKFVLMNVVC